MTFIEDLKADLIRDEGVIPYAYQDSLGYWTVGAGFMIDRAKGGELRPEEIDFILNNRINLKLGELQNRWPTFKVVPEPVQRALGNMAYQLGVEGLMGFSRALNAIQAARYGEAADELMDSRWARQTPARAKRIAELVRSANNGATR